MIVRHCRAKLILLIFGIFVILSSGCTGPSGNGYQEEKPIKTYQINEPTVMGSEGYEIELNIEDAFVRKVSLPNQNVEYDIGGFTFFDSGDKGDNLFIKFNVEGVGYKASILSRPYIIITDSYDEEFVKHGSIFSKEHSKHGGGLSVQHKVIKEYLGEYKLTNLEYVKSARIQIETENEIIVIPIEIINLIDNVKPVDYKTFPANWALHLNPDF